MKNYRNCNASGLDTGQSKCPLDLSKVIGALIVKHGYKLPADLTGEILEEACHAAPDQRVRPVFDFVEYAPSGGEVQVSAVGYGPNKATGVSARDDVFTTAQYSEHLASAFTKAMNNEFDVYFVDEHFNLYGLNDGTDILAGFPMSTIYHGGTPHPTSSNAATQTLHFCHKDARKAIEDFDYRALDFDPRRFAYGLVPVKFIQLDGGKYKIVEAQGGYDRTAEFGATIAATPTAVFKGSVTAATYDADTETLTITGGTPVLKSPADLYTAGVKGIVGV